MRTTLAWSGLALAVLAGAGCSLFESGPDPEQAWESQDLQSGPPRRDLMKACEWAVLQADFPVSERDDVAGRVVSGWNVNLSPFSYQGTRSRATIEVEDLGQPSAYRIRVRVEVQRNQEVHRTLDLSEAEWEDDGFDQVRARIVLQQVLAQVRRH